MARQSADISLLVRSFQLSRMIAVVAGFEIADRIGDQPVSVAELARGCGAHPAMLLRLLRALAAFGIFLVTEDGNVAHSGASRRLRRNSTPTFHHAARYWTTPGNWAAWAKLEHTIRTGAPAFEAVFGMPNFEYLNGHPDEAERFNAFMQHSPDDRHTAVADAYDFATFRTLVDVGGGNGALLAVLLRRYEHLRGVLFDQANTVAAAQSVFGPVIARCSIEAGDFFGRVPAGGDAYLLSQILHDWDDEHCLRILANCRASMPPGSRLLVIERVLDPTSDPMNYLSDMDMMLLFPGAKERTLKEFAELFTAAGFGPPSLTLTNSPFSIIETQVVAQGVSFIPMRL